MKKLLAPNGRPSNLTPEQWRLVRTKAFKDWFGDWQKDPKNASKVVDENGEPLAVYHGSPKNNITKFRKNFDGIFFSDNISLASQYSGTLLLKKTSLTSQEKAILNKNYPNIYNLKDLFEDLKNIGYKIDVEEENIQDDYGKYKWVTRAKITNLQNEVHEYNIDYQRIDWLQGTLRSRGRNYQVFLNIRKPLIVDAKNRGWDNIKYNNRVVSTMHLGIEAKEQGFDGVIIPNVYDSGIKAKTIIAYAPTQIKLADGSNTTFDGSNPDIRFELGGIYHGSPYRFEKFSTAHMGTGEGAQAFGWGLYFTELEDIANRYAKIKQNSEALANYIYGTGYTVTDVEAIERMTNAKLKEKILDRYEERVKEINERYSENTDFKQHLLDTALKLQNKYLDAISLLTPTKYKVTLHKGKTPDQYTWLEWDKIPTKKQIQAILNGLDSDDFYRKRTEEYGYDYKIILNSFNIGYSGKDIYQSLSAIVGGDKQASLFLLENGIDGIKFPAESIARGATSDTARGFNYVVFDENAVSIENVEQFAKGGLIAPNGKPSNLTPEQYALVRTPEFKAWFGDWENEPETASKVVDENGEPLVVYHGTNEEFYKFDKSKGKGNIKQKTINFSNNKKVSKDYGSRVLECFLNIKNPFIKNYNGESYHTIDFNARYKYKFDEIPDAIVNNAFDKKIYDGVIFENIRDSKSKYSQNVPIGNNYYAFKNTQIKLADGTNTTFSPTSPDIRYSKGGILRTLRTKFPRILSSLDLPF